VLITGRFVFVASKRLAQNMLLADLRLACSRLSLPDRAEPQNGEKDESDVSKSAGYVPSTAAQR